MNKEEIILRINKLVEMLYTKGEIKGLKEGGEIFSPGISGSVDTRTMAGQTTETSSSVGSDPHPSRGVKSWSAKSFTVKIHDEDDTIEFWVDGEIKNRHQSNAAAVKFEQLLMQVKDQLASWNALGEKKDN